jgi:hypothetical protein
VFGIVLLGRTIGCEVECGLAFLSGMDRSELDAAINDLCKRFTWHCEVEVLMVGGAAGMLTGLLPRDRVTVDCDVIKYVPQDAWVQIELLAEKIGRERGLPDNWFNSDISSREDLIPNGWRDRRVWIDQGEYLSVWSISRVDLIAMKFFAHRPQDLEDLDSLGVTEDDVEFVRMYLAALPAKGTPSEPVAEATEVLMTWSDRE